MASSSDLSYQAFRGVRRGEAEREVVSDSLLYIHDEVSSLEIRLDSRGRGILQSFSDISEFLRSCQAARV